MPSSRRLLVCLSMVSFGHLAMWAILLVGLFNSIMFPSIFTLGIEGLGPLTGEGSGLLVMAIVGGAIVPELQGIAGRPHRVASRVHSAGAVLSVHSVLRRERTAAPRLRHDRARLAASRIVQKLMRRTEQRSILRGCCLQLLMPPCLLPCRSYGKRR